MRSLFLPVKTVPKFSPATIYFYPADATCFLFLPNLNRCPHSAHPPDPDAAGRCPLTPPDPSGRRSLAGVAPTPHTDSSSRHRPSEGATPLAPPPVAVTPLPPLHAPLRKVGAPWLLVGRLEQAASNQEVNKLLKIC